MMLSTTPPDATRTSDLAEKRKQPTEPLKNGVLEEEERLKVRRLELTKLEQLIKWNLTNAKHLMNDDCDDDTIDELYTNDLFLKYKLIQVMQDDTFTAEEIKLMRKETEELREECWNMMFNLPGKCDRNNNQRTKEPETKGKETGARMPGTTSNHLPENTLNTETPDNTPDVDDLPGDASEARTNLTRKQNERKEAGRTGLNRKGETRNNARERLDRERRKGLKEERTEHPSDYTSWGAAAGTWAQHRKPGEPDTKENKPGGPDLTENLGRPGRKCRSEKEKLGEPGTEEKLGEPGTEEKLGEPGKKEELGEPGTKEKLGEPATEKRLGELVTANAESDFLRAAHEQKEKTSGEGQRTTYAAGKARPTNSSSKRERAEDFASSHFRRQKTPADLEVTLPHTTATEGEPHFADRGDHAELTPQTCPTTWPETLAQCKTTLALSANDTLPHADCGTTRLEPLALSMFQPTSLLGSADFQLARGNFSEEESPYDSSWDHWAWCPDWTWSAREGVLTEPHFGTDDWNTWSAMMKHFGASPTQPDGPETHFGKSADHQFENHIGTEDRTTWPTKTFSSEEHFGTTDDSQNGNHFEPDGGPRSTNGEAYT